MHAIHVTESGSGPNGFRFRRISALRASLDFHAAEDEEPSAAEVMYSLGAEVADDCAETPDVADEEEEGGEEEEKLEPSDISEENDEAPLMRRPAAAPKRPAAADEDGEYQEMEEEENTEGEEEDYAVLKRPAGNMKRPAAADLRESAKVRKVQQIWGTLPRDIQEIWRDAHRHPDGKRSRETAIVNNMFKTVNNKLVLNTDSPFFERELKVKKSKTGTDAHEGVHRTIFAETFKDGDAGVQQAMGCGAVKEWKVDGQPYCAIRKVTVESKQALEHAKCLSTSGPATKEQAAAIEKAAREMSFGFSLETGGALSLADGMASSSSGEVTQTTIDKLSQALVIV
ncbi:unnamed protein product [Prorocentrum cordatum]|uniref:Uncharacterized protein n=1 Tax=Prorocentrum cordatum TaxID=2364126 RepID=A0ABN9V8K6_9DINO|nr:unnamed protein product [Polarella glacialis]